MQSSLFNSPLLETIICLVLVYALLSLLASTIAEIVNFYFKERGRMLYQAISTMFEDMLNVNFGQMLYDHPVIASLRKDRDNLPQYISPQIFSSCIIDVIGNYSRIYEHEEGKGIILKYGNILLRDNTADNRTLFERCSDSITNMKHTEVKLLLMNMIDRSDFENNNSSKALIILQQQMEQWFNAQMDRITGWYKTKTSVRLRWVAFVIAISLNVNSINVFTGLMKSSALRSKILPITESVSKSYQDQNNDTIQSKIAAARAKTMNQALHLVDSITNLEFPIGWKKGLPPFTFKSVPAWQQFKRFWEHLCYLLFYLLGILITAFSISVGAPFWFDVLLKFVNIRKAGVKPSSSKS